MQVIQLGHCSICGKLTTKCAAGHFLCPACIEAHGAAFTFGAKTMERILCRTRLAKIKLRDIVKNIKWW
jgi:hypothetical protein